MALKALGKVTVTSAGTPVRCTVNQTTPSDRLGLQSLSVYAPATNAGDLFIGFTGMNTSTYAGVVGIIPKGTWWSSVINLAPVGIDARDLYIDAANSNDKALVVGTEQ